MMHIVICQDPDDWRDSYFFGPFNSGEEAEQGLEDHKHDVNSEPEVARLLAIAELGGKKGLQAEDKATEMMDSLIGRHWCGWAVGWDNHLVVPLDGVSDG